MSDNVLPEFEGNKVHKATLRIVGTGDGLSEDFAIDDVLKVGQRVRYVIEGTVSQINHRTGKESDVYIRQQTVKAERMTSAHEDAHILGMLDHAAERAAKLRDEQSGQLRIEPAVADPAEPEHKAFSDEHALPTEKELAAAGVGAID